MNKKVLIIIVLAFSICMFGFMYLETNGISKKIDNEQEVKAPQIQNDTAQESFKEDSNLLEKYTLKDLFVEITDTHPANNELQNYIIGQNKFDGNKIAITVNKEQEQFISGKVESKFGFRYGDIKLRIKPVENTGLFPAIWMLPITDYNYPELDLFEMIGNDPEKFYGVLHYLENGEKRRNFFEYKFKKNNVPEVYELEIKWTPNKITWYLMGEKIHELDGNETQVPMYIIINCAVGGNWPGAPSDTMKLPKQFEVEIVDFKPKEVFTR